MGRNPGWTVGRGAWALLGPGDQLTTETDGETFHPSGCMSQLSLRDKAPPRWGARTSEIPDLTALEARSLQCRGGQGRLLLGL